MTTDGQPNIVEFRDVSFHINGGPSIIDGMNLAVASGETLVLLGESGCGKTTTLRLVNRLLTPSTGKVLVEARATTDWDVIRLRRRTGYVIQEAGLFPHFTVAENVGLVPSLEHWEQVRISDRVNELLSLVGLDPTQFAARYPRELSGGQRQRVGVARALAADPPLLLMDEPFGALDPQTRWGMQSLLLDVSRSENNTILFVTHDVSEAVYLADTIYVLSARPARILHQVDVPAFPVHDMALKSAPEFRAVEKRLLDLIYAPAGGKQAT
jgi:osmoprotectant transport system ATP-binding protein